MSTIGIVAISVGGGVLILLLNGLFAKNASNMASDKGYEKRKWFHMCFWLGVISYIIIASMPDRTLQAKQDETNELLKEMIRKFDSVEKKQPVDRKDDINSYLPEL